MILVTHNLALTGRLAENVVEIGSDGRIAQRETIAEALEADAELAAQLVADEEAVEKADEAIDDSLDAEAKKGEAEASGKLMLEEDIAIGHVNLSASELTTKRHVTSSCISWF